ncbi:pentapeptide repeat-containing protein, partial [Vibrio vulnificus]|nr:pentapeptide repeat-containing protein [Vibrio vulnificus]
MPRELTDLPFADHLRPFDGVLEPEANVDTVHLDGLDFDDVPAAGSRFTEAALSSVTFSGGRLRRSRFSDVWMDTVRWMGTDLVESSWLDVELNGGALAGIQLFDARLRRVAFSHCKLDAV